MAFIERLIFEIKKHPILFDTTHPHYKHVKRKIQIWEAIGAEFNETGDGIKRKWKNVRDTYSKFIRKGSITKKKWQWASQMELFRPFMTISQHERKISEPNNFIDFESSETQEIHESANCGTPEFLIKEEPNELSYMEPEPPSSTVRELPIKQQKTQEVEQGNPEDATELIFKGYAQIVKSFSPRRQAVTKMEIAKIIMQQELEHQEEVMCSKSSCSEFTPAP